MSKLVSDGDNARRQSCIVYLNTQEAVLHNNSPPLLVNRFAIR
jgi:hypothetical protein